MTYADRVYDRDLVLWDWDALYALQAEGKAQRLVDHGVWIVKRDEGGQVVVRDNQVLVGDGLTAEEAAAQQEAEIWAENAWLRHAENAGWEETELERQIEAERGVIPFDVAMRQAEAEYSVAGDIDGDNAYTKELIASEDEARARERARIRAEESELLSKFGIGG